MVYSELIKNFNRIREYMRSFYVYGFKHREEYAGKSARSYDDERRRLQSWLGDYMQFRQTAEGKTVFLSIDSRLSRHNPLYKGWKAKSFTDGDITLHFLLFDILWEPSICLSLNEITEQLDEYLSQFQNSRTFDTSTVRKKLTEYAAEGIIQVEKRGKTAYYRRAEDIPAPAPDLLDLASEIMPCGVIGSFLLDKGAPHREHFAFKHHYITGAMDSEIICALFLAMQEKREVTLELLSRRKELATEHQVVPLRILASVQGGRQYLLAYEPRLRRIGSYRVDYIVSLTPGEVCPEFDARRDQLEGMLPHLWGVSTQGGSGKRLEQVSFTVSYRSDESFILERLLREKRCGTVEELDAHHARFSAEVYDSSELVPWIRTFLCRITELYFSNEAVERRFREDIQQMYAQYGLEGGEPDAVQ